jgi:hypothetical protein
MSANQSGGGMAVGVQRQRNRAAAEQVLDQLRMGACLEQHAGGGVATNLRQPGTVKGDLEGVGDGATRATRLRVQLALPQRCGVYPCRGGPRAVGGL